MHLSKTHHLHACVNEWHSNVWGSEIHIITRPKRHPIPSVSGFHQAAEAEQKQNTNTWTLVWNLYRELHHSFTEKNWTEKKW